MRHIVLKWVFWGNYIFCIFYMSRFIKPDMPLEVQSIAPLLISTFMLIDIAYINSCSIRESKILNLFCGLLALDSWYVLLSMQDYWVENIVFAAVSPIIWYCSITFILFFLFQGSGYQFHRVIRTLLPVSCAASIVGLCISDKTFACMYGIQFLVGIACLLFAVIYHWKRVVFVLKSEKISFLVSFGAIAILFVVYYFMTLGIPNHISNFGIYLPAMLFFMSVHGIVLKEYNDFPLLTVFTWKQMVFIISLSLGILGLSTLLLGKSFIEFLMSVNALFAFLDLSNIILGQNLKQSRGKIISQSKYDAALQQFKKEEQLKTEFSNFLHDDVLQDLLSIKNMMGKANQPDIHDIITETLDNMNTQIREQMQDYHPVILKNLSIKENYRNLFESISQSFPERKIAILFDCADTLFLVEPYNLLLYRLLKELLVNVYKHSDASQAWVSISQRHSIIVLCVSDDGSADASNLTALNIVRHKGLASIREQVENVNGIVKITNNTPKGVCIQITFYMEGEDSYQYFVG